MELPKRVTLGYSLKNIPIPSTSSYKKRLIEMVESVIKRMRWRAFFYLRSGSDETSEGQDEHYGFNSRRCPPQVEELKAFETDMGKLVKNIKFRKANDSFQNTLRREVTRIKNSEELFVPAAKTRNLYVLGREQHEKLLRENITKHYKAADQDAYDNINLEAQAISRNLGLADRMDTMAKAGAFISLKDHKDNFENSLPCRLINPAKSEMGLVSKRVLDNINSRLKAQLDVVLWKNSAAVIDWFSSLQGKDECTFISFDIVEYYASISEELLGKALDFAKQHVDITSDEWDIIHHSRKSLLFDDGRAWMKKEGGGLFDVTMGSYDGAEVCELVGIFVLTQLPQQFRAGNTGLYRDDGLSVFRKMSGSAAERAKKDLSAHFKTLGLRITAQANLKTTNFLDLTLNLRSGKYYPYRKPNDRPVYIHRLSNHPPAILKQLPAAVSRRLTDISSDEETFSAAAPIYDDALRDSGFAESAQYISARKSPPQRPRRKRNRPRRITWFNPPFSKNVATNVGQRFLRLIDHHFPAPTKLHRIFNRGTVKVSYSCLPNMSRIIKRHNNSIRRKGAPTSGRPPRRCNCRQPADCPLRGQCQDSGVVYQATVSTPNASTPAVYIGSTDTTFKERFANHKMSFRHEKYSNRTELSKHVWELKHADQDFNIEWNIIQHASAYSNISKQCQLCLTEKFLISEARAGRSRERLLNQRSELVSMCRHRHRYLLSRFSPSSLPPG